MKAKLIAAVLENLEEQIERTDRAVKDAAAGSTHTEAKTESKYDTRAIESGYLAGAQAQRLIQLKSKRNFLKNLYLPTFKADDLIAPLALVAVGERLVFILPYLDGQITNIDGQQVAIVKPESKLGEELIGLYRGDVTSVGVIDAVT